MSGALHSSWIARRRIDWRTSGPDAGGVSRVRGKETKVQLGIFGASRRHENKENPEAGCVILE